MIYCKTIFIVFLGLIIYMLNRAGYFGISREIFHTFNDFLATCFLIFLIGSLKKVLRGSWAHYKFFQSDNDAFLASILFFLLLIFFTAFESNFYGEQAAICAYLALVVGLVIELWRAKKQYN